MKIHFRKLNDTGAIMIEVAFLFPVFLLFIFFVVWAGRILYIKESIYSSVTRSVNLAKTRGNFKTMNYSVSDTDKGSLAYIDAYFDKGTKSPRLLKLLGSKKSEKRGINALDKHTSFLTQSDCVTRKNYKENKNYTACFYPNASLRDMPREAMYALVFAASEMKSLLGSNVIVPCNPGAENELIGGTAEQQGCLRCNLMPLEEMGLGDCKDESCKTFINSKGVAIDRFGIECFYRYPAKIIQSLFNLIGIDDVGMGILIKAKQWTFLERNKFCLQNPSLSECN